MTAYRGEALMQRIEAAERQKVAAAGADSERLVQAFIDRHQSAAIPALIGSCGLWAVESGGAEVFKGTLDRAKNMVDEMLKLRQNTAQ